MSAYGSLGASGVLRAYLAALSANQAETSAFGWRTRGIIGTLSLKPRFITYKPHTPGSPGLPSVFQEGSVIWPEEQQATQVPVYCSSTEAFRWMGEKILYPFAFFDWCKGYLAYLRIHQPSFAAQPEEKLVWTTHVAWVLNQALGATNIHGALLPSAIFNHLSGERFEAWAGDGSYMYTAQHAALFPDYWKQAFNMAMQQTVATKKGTLVLDSGFRSLRPNGAVVCESAWRGSVWPAPYEVARYRFDPILNVGEDCPVSGTCKPKVDGLAGAKFGIGWANDPTSIRNSIDKFDNDGGAAIARFSRWSQSMPWVDGLQAWGAVKSVTDEDAKDSLLREALIMSTFFTGLPGVQGDFWTKLAEWKTVTHATPGLYRTVAPVYPDKTEVYAPNHELSFRFFYPAMIDTVLKCDYYGLVSEGHNVWWKYNISTGVGGVGQYRPTESTTGYDTNTGVLLRDASGAPNVPPVAPTGVPQQAFTGYAAAKKAAQGLSILINWASTLLAVVMVVFGRVGPLVKAGYNWYKFFTTKYPVPEDAWRGVVPPTPLLQRTLPTYGLVDVSNPGGAQPRFYLPDTTSEPRYSVQDALSGTYGVQTGGPDAIQVMRYVQFAAVMSGNLYGLPFTFESLDASNPGTSATPVCGLKSNAPRSLLSPTYPVPGTFDPTTQLLPADYKQTHSKTGLKILAAGFVAAMGTVLLLKKNNVKKNVKRLRHGR